jgi:hypothetical protein
MCAIMGGLLGVACWQRIRRRRDSGPVAGMVEAGLICGVIVVARVIFDRRRAA